MGWDHLHGAGGGDSAVDVDDNAEKADNFAHNFFPTKNKSRC